MASPYRTNTAPEPAEPTPHEPAPWWRRLFRPIVAAAVPPLRRLAEPMKAPRWMCPRCPHCDASWFANVMVLTCKHDADCHIINDRFAHAHYVCNACGRPFWVSFRTDI